MDRREQEERYINPLTDFGFKRIFGTDFNKDLLISFLNALLDGERVITNLTYNNTERFGTNSWARKAIFDVYCTTDTGGRIIVEMQNMYQDFYKDRSIYYSTFAITDQAVKGKRWNYELDDVYTIGILNFAFPEEKKDKDGCIFKEVKLYDHRTKELFYEKLTYIYVMLANFHKPLSECYTLIDKWLFCLRNLSNLMDRPAELQGRVFEKLFQEAEIAKFSPTERKEYEQSMNAYNEILNGIETARREGEKEGEKRGLAIGEQKGLEQVARKMLAAGMSITQISQFTGLSEEQIKGMYNN